ncbi:hypothetical protein TorRG33x02_177630, partial [Trema orientale]
LFLSRYFDLLFTCFDMGGYGTKPDGGAPKLCYVALSLISMFHVLNRTPALLRSSLFYLDVSRVEQNTPSTMLGY